MVAGNPMSVELQNRLYISRNKPAEPSIISSGKPAAMVTRKELDSAFQSIFSRPLAVIMVLKRSEHSAHPPNVADFCRAALQMKIVQRWPGLTCSSIEGLKFSQAAHDMLIGIRNLRAARKLLTLLKCTRKAGQKDFQWATDIKNFSARY